MNLHKITGPKSDRIYMEFLKEKYAQWEFLPVSADGTQQYRSLPYPGQEVSARYETLPVGFVENQRIDAQLWVDHGRPSIQS